MKMIQLGRVAIILNKSQDMPLRTRYPLPTVEYEDNYPLIEFAMRGQAILSWRLRFWWWKWYIAVRITDKKYNKLVDYKEGNDAGKEQAREVDKE